MQLQVAAFTTHAVHLAHPAGHRPWLLQVRQATVYHLHQSLVETSTFNSSTTKESVQIRHRLTCQSSNIVYRLYCDTCQQSSNIVYRLYCDTCQQSSNIVYRLYCDTCQQSSNIVYRLTLQRHLPTIIKHCVPSLQRHLPTIIKHCVPSLLRHLPTIIKHCVPSLHRHLPTISIRSRNKEYTQDQILSAQFKHQQNHRHASHKTLQPNKPQQPQHEVCRSGEGTL